MERTLISSLKEQIGQKVKLQGWVQTIRDQGGIHFLVIRDISGLVQTVVSGPLLEKSVQLSAESVVEVIGMVKDEPKAFSGFEIAAEEIILLSHAEPELPIPIVEKGNSETEQNKRLDWRFLDLRRPEKQLIYKVWTELERSFFEYCIGKGYIEIHSPKLMSSPSEGGAELFEVKYFERKAYLAQSPQFYKQMAMAAGFEQVFEIGPVFRAEPSFTPRHATEFNGFDLEKSFITSHQDIIQEEEQMLIYALGNIREKYGEQIKKWYGREVIVPPFPFPQIAVAEAKRVLAAQGVESEREGDLSPEEERRLSAYVAAKYGHEFVFVTDYPADVRAFYHMRLESNPALTKGFDLLWSGIEVTTGAQREHRYEVLVKQAQEKGVGLPSIQFYLDFFKYGCPPHGGLGAGPERMVMKILGLENIREASYIYRGVKRLTP